MVLKHGSLFSGIGGFDLASEWMGWENVFHCEWNEFGQKILKYYWPKAISYGDITKTDFTIHRGKIDILTGGFPCQPYSAAGKRLGKEDDRHLWPEMLRAIQEIQPRYVVGENVSGIINWNGGLVFDEVQSDLENEGYEVIPIILPACGKNAPHKRERVWFVANSINNRHKTGRRTTKKKNGIQEKHREKMGSREFNRTGISRTTPNRANARTKSLRQKRGNSIYEFKYATNSNNQGLQGGKNQRIVGTGRENGNEQPTRFFQPNWENFPTKSPICSRDDGLSSKLDGITFPKWRNESIKAYGNAIVPQVVYEIFKAII